MSHSIYIVNPRESVPSFFSSEILEAAGFGRVPMLSDLTTPTIAAMVPADWAVTICDERCEEVNFETAAEVVAITAKVSQRERMIAIAQEFRRRGKLVLGGGPHASLCPTDVRAHVDVLVRGEIEDIAATIFADIAAGQPKPEYVGGKPDLGNSPLPRWDLYPHTGALAGQVQTSRGCPFECEFCDVIQYLGRKQRWKEPPQVIAELDQLYRLGYREVFLADDNFTVFRRRARALLEAVARWNEERSHGRVRFFTQLSIDITRDPELLALAVRAGLDRSFIGIETPNEDALREVMKRQNMRVDLAAELRTVVQSGMMPVCGMIVGFDHDGLDIFERQAEFIASLPVPVVQIGPLVAPQATPLYARMKAEGRLIEEIFPGGGNLAVTNIRPLQMSLEELQSGLQWLLNQVFSPDAWGARMEHFVDLAPLCPYPRKLKVFNVLETRLVRWLARKGPAERRLVERLTSLAKRRPDLMSPMGYALLIYCQTRYVLDHFKLWNSDCLQTLASPNAPVARLRA